MSKMFRSNRPTCPRLNRPFTNGRLSHVPVGLGGTSTRSIINQQRCYGCAALMLTYSLKLARKCGGEDDCQGKDYQWIAALAFSVFCDLRASMY